MPQSGHFWLPMMGKVAGPVPCDCKAAADVTCQLLAREAAGGVTSSVSKLILSIIMSWEAYTIGIFLQLWFIYPGLNIRCAISFSITWKCKGLLSRLTLQSSGCFLITKVNYSYAKWLFTHEFVCHIQTMFSLRWFKSTPLTTERLLGIIDPFSHFQYLFLTCE